MQHAFVAASRTASIVATLAGAMDAKDGWMRLHCETVRHLSDGIGRIAGLRRHPREQLCLAAGLHDVGKIFIPM